MLWNLQSLRGFSLTAQMDANRVYYDKAGEGMTLPSKEEGEIGNVREVYFDDASWTVRYLVVDTGSWLTGRSVLILPKDLGQADWEKQTIPVSLTTKRIEESPSIDTDKPVSRQHEADVLSFYGTMPYWSDPSGFFPIYDPRLVAPPEATEAPPGSKGDPHLRSSREVAGYRIHASDGHLGHVEDFVVDDETWRIHYLVVDTRDWWPGKKVFVAPSWIESIEWRSREVSICLPREVLQRAPEYDASLPISSQYERQLLDYYRA